MKKNFDPNGDEWKILRDTVTVCEISAAFNFIEYNLHGW